MKTISSSSLGAIPLFLARIAPFLLPALFFESAIFAFISPLPLFILTLKRHLRFSALALITNGLIIHYAGTPTEFAVAITLWFMVGVLFPFLIRKTGRVPFSFAVSFVGFLTLILTVLITFAVRNEVNVIDFMRLEMRAGINQLASVPESPIKKLIEEQGTEGLLKQLMTEIPSGLIITLILAFWVNLLFASQVLRGFLSKSFWASYRNPDWLIWPTLASAALFAFGDHVPYYIGLNSFKVLMVLYGFQGLSIVSHLLNRYKILGLGRTLIFATAIFGVMPLVISLGFFDLWFDFRRKFGQN